MRTFINVLLFLFSTLCCSESGKSSAHTQIEGYELSNIIDLTAGFRNIRSIRLSEIADSVSFIPFETTVRSLQGQGQKSLITLSPAYIFYYNMAFGWNGNYCGTIVKRGQGPFEEPEGGTLAYSNNHFYSKGTKFMEYDLTGKPTGKVRNLFAAREFATNDFLRRGTDFSPIGENFIVYDFPTTLYYFNKNFETIASRIVFMADSVSPGASSLGSGKCVTYYKEKVLFYNFMNDTIFYVTGTGLEPQWIVSFDDQLRLPVQAMLNSRDLLRNALSGRVGLSEVKQQIDHKHKVIAAYETDKYIFFQMTETIMNVPSSVETPPPDPYIIYYDKKTGKTTRVKGKGFEDDLLGFDHFYPELGVFDEKLITFIWPFELLEYIKECRNKGREVNQQLLALSKQVKEDDNPVLILVHLKK